MAKAPPKKEPPPPPPPKAKTAKPQADKSVAAASSGKTNGKAAKPAPKPQPAAPARTAKPAPAFPKKNQPPTAAAFAARLPLPLGKRFDAVRALLLKQTGVREDVYFYGP